MASPLAPDHCTSPLELERQTWQELEKCALRQELARHDLRLVLEGRTPPPDLVRHTQQEQERRSSQREQERCTLPQEQAKQAGAGEVYSSTGAGAAFTVGAGEPVPQS